MYAITWAQEVFRTYEMSCTRARQIEGCLSQAIESCRPSCVFPRRLVQEALIQSIRGKDKSRLWGKFKRLCKKTPLDGALLEELAKKIYWMAVDEVYQREFDFNA